MSETLELPAYVVWNAPNGDHPARRASQRSYTAVGTGVLAEWLKVYAEDAVIEDPVGPSWFDPEGKGHHGHAGISAFWDKAIAPIEQFIFTITDSHACGNSCANIGTITTRLDPVWTLLDGMSVRASVAIAVKRGIWCD